MSKFDAIGMSCLLPQWCIQATKSLTTGIDLFSIPTANNIYFLQFFGNHNILSISKNKVVICNCILIIHYWFIQ